MRRLPFFPAILLLLAIFSQLTLAQTGTSYECSIHSRQLSACRDTLFGRMPDGIRDEIRVCHNYYLVSSNSRTKAPNWVAYHLIAGNATARIKKGDYFDADPCLPVGKRAELSDYNGIFPKYNRGHMTPAMSNKVTMDIYRESYYLSNMVPQNPGNNGGIWQTLEEYVDKWTAAYGEVYVITGPVYDYKHIQHEVVGGGLWAPAALFKIIYSPSKQKILSFIIPNVPLDRNALVKYLTSVDEVNHVTGLNLFSDLPRSLSAEVSTSLWPLYR